MSNCKPMTVVNSHSKYQIVGLVWFCIGGMFFGSSPQWLPAQVNALEQDAGSSEETVVESISEQAAAGLPYKELDWIPSNTDDRLSKLDQILNETRVQNVELFRQQLEAKWQSPQPLRIQLRQMVDLCRETFAETRAIEDRLVEEVSRLQVPVERSDEERWLRNHVLLNLGCQWAREQKYDFAQVALHSLRAEGVLFPSELLFYRGMVSYKLLHFAAARQDLELLLKHREDLDRRSSTLSELMLADLPEADDGSLRQIARVMDDALRRQTLKQAGQRVLEGEQKVVDLLDQLIKQKEEQQQQQQQKQGQTQSKSSKPLDKGMRAPLLGKGEVDPKRMSAKEWGDLPPAKQAEVIAEMTRQMPPHYKKVIEEYFRRLADDKLK